MYDNNDDGCAGCLTLFIIAAIFCWIEDNWTTILIVIGAIIAIAAIIAGVKIYKSKAPEREAAAKAKAEKEAEEKLAKEEASYRAYVSAYKGSTLLEAKLHTANMIIDKLHEETDESRRIKVLAFFDRYLPVITEIIEASKHGDADIDDSVNRFTDSVKAFSKSLYKVDEVVDVNSTVLENMAIRDGFYDPYAEDLSFDNDADAEPAKKAVNENADIEASVGTAVTPDAEEPVAMPARIKRLQKTVPTVEDIEMAMQDRLDEAILMDDFDTIRDMLDSGVISELDMDDDVLSNIEEYC